MATTPDTLDEAERQYKAAIDAAAVVYRDAVQRALAGEAAPVVPHDPDAPVVDEAALAVDFRGRRCELGGGLLLALFRRLARRPGTFVAVDALRGDTWRGRVVGAEAIRQALHRLRRRLREGGMDALADAIVGEAGYVVLRPVWRRNVTETSRRCRAARNGGRR